MHATSFVSVIVPVRNGEKIIGNLICALLSQDYPKSHTEIIVVDNGSQDKTCETVRKYPVILGTEDKVISSYAARNKGLLMAGGEIIAFTDADCLPERNWISEGVRALQEENADMAGGRVSFILSDNLSPAEFVDSMTFMRNEQYVENRGAVTANLFVRSHLFRQVGFFPGVRSGGDIQWTAQAVQAGFPLIFVPQAIVRHPLRSFDELIKKFWRVGTGIGWGGGRHQRKEYGKIFYLALRLSIPLPQKNIRNVLIGRRKKKELMNKRLAIWLVSYIGQLSMLGGMLSSVFQKSEA